MIRSTSFVSALMIAVAAILLGGCAALNQFRTEGELPLAGLEAAVTVKRDAQGMAYIHARSLTDALTAQGFVTAQDRLFQMELTRRMAAGRISEFVGQKARGLDVRMRAIGCLRIARRHAAILSPQTRNYLQRYADGINAYIDTRRATYPIEFKLAGIHPEPWDLADSLSIAYLLGWQTSANLKHEIVAQFLVETLGEARAAEFFPLNINPDDPPHENSWLPTPDTAVTSQGILPATDNRLADPYGGENALHIGSNNWAVAPARTSGAKPIVANDPHLDARLLPGPFYPCGLFTPDLQAVGAGIPGIPGMVIFRNGHIATSSSNSYGDSQDLYIENVDPRDPSRYLEGDRSYPFEFTHETIGIKDKKAPGGMREEAVVIRRTHRGPVVSGLLPGLGTERVVTLRWSPVETMEPRIGLEDLLQARSVKEVRDALSHVTIVMLNFIFADTDGNIGWQSTGKLPIRSPGDGSLPFAVTDGKDNWHGWIPFEQMPSALNPEKGWLGACNHKTVGVDFPYYYSSYFAPSNRYRRLEQLMEPDAPTTADDHWQWQLDTLNLTATAVAPKMAASLAGHPETAEMARILSQWNFRDDPKQVAPTLFHATYLAFVRRVLSNQVGAAAAEKLLDDPYFWQERMEQVALSDDSPWIDDATTESIETFDDTLYPAARDAKAALAAQMGPDVHSWQWGRVHRMEFLNPIRRTGFGAGWLGGGSHPAPGSSATLNRGRYDFNHPYKVVVSPAMRVVFDLADPDKITAVLAGGVSGRTFSPHQTDQVEAFMAGEKRYWWFSKEAVSRNAVSTLVLKPAP